jgi:putative tricarboxylic transport membrane protein
MRRDLTCSLVLLAVAALYYALARDLGQTALSDAVGPAGLPMAYAAVLALLAVLLGAVAWLRRRLGATAASGVSPGDAEAEAGPARRVRRAAGALGIGVIYLLIVPWIGYPFAIALAIAAMAVYQGERPTLRLVLIACAGAGALFALFDLVLGVPTPAPWNV